MGRHVSHLWYDEPEVVAVAVIVVVDVGALIADSVISTNIVGSGRP